MGGKYVINNIHSREIWELLDRVPSSLLVVSNMCFLSNVGGRSLMEGGCVSGWQICDQQHSLSRDLGTIG